MQVVPKDGATATATTVEAPSLERPSIVQLKIAPEKVARFERHGDDLTLVLRDGSTTLIPGFFAGYPDNGRNDLLLEDDAGVLWWGQYSSPWSEFHFTEIEWLDGAPVLPTEGIPAWLLAGLALLGVGAAASGGGGGGGAAPSLVVNQPPSGEAHALGLRAGEVGQGRVVGRDADGDVVSYTLSKLPVHGSVTLDPATGEFTYTPESGYQGSDAFEVTIDDGKGGSSVVGVPVTVEPPENQAPTASAPPLSTLEDQPVDGKVTAEDVDGDTLAFTVGESPQHGTVTLDAESGEYTYTPDADYQGTDSFTVVVSDGNGGTTTSTVNVTVTPVNDAPAVPNYTLTTPEDTPLEGRVVGSDVDGDDLSYAVGTPPANGTVVLNPDGSYSYNPGTNFNGADSFTVVVSDGNGGTTTSTVNVTVAPVNDAPAAPNYTLTTPEDTPLEGRVVGSDVDGDDLSYAVGTSPANGTVVLNPDGSYSYNPGTNFNGTDSFTVVVSDGNGGTTTSTVNVTVTPVNDAPVFVDPDNGAPVDTYDFGYEENSPQTAILGVVQTTDGDSPSVTYAIVAGNESGWFEIDAIGQIRLTPAGVAAQANDYEAGPNVHALTVRASDGSGGETDIAVTLSEQDTNEAPTVSVTAGGTLYEEGLPDGIHSGPAPATVTTGTLSIADGDTGTVPSDLTVSLVGPAGSTSGGQPVVWSWNASTTTLTGTTTVDGISTQVMSIQVGPVSQTGAGNFTAVYTATLTGAIDHPASGEDALSLNFAATVSDGVNTSPVANIVVTVQDDAPVLGDGAMTVNVEPLQTNLMVILDLSGSMGNENPSRLERAKQAIENLIESYDSYGDVKVKLVTFSTGGQARVDWMDPVVAISTINALSASGSTNYWAALQAAMGSSGYDAQGKLVGPNVQNVSYFFTDGEPTSGNGITASRESQWVEFVAGRDIHSYAIGIGNSLDSTHQAQVDPIAYDGSEGGAGTNTNGLIISDTSQLDEVLQGTVGAPASGNLLAGGLGEGQGFGADGGHVSSLTIDGDVYTYDSETGVMTVAADAGAPNYSYSELTKAVTITTEAGGTLVVNFATGEFTYQAKPEAYTEVLTYQVTDGDGDVSNVATQTLNVTFAADPAPAVAPPEALDLDAAAGRETVAESSLETDAEAMTWTDLLRGHSASESSLEALLTSALPTAAPQAEAASPAAWSDAGALIDTSAYTPPSVSALDEDIHHTSVMYV
ncbi:tandem-95 repeat protein [Variovorax sp. UMC13]|uniref:tandem-95 repeat protein n=1 Tax=Variovorax sp. UMC13 TaxID=1862326 RepID=UPI0016012DA5|nr:tandem-95 repeat protein [Variovorax sp. UMC13]MBB1600751.1 hypothetical protein [Variovorax sp. UMC13]